MNYQPGLLKTGFIALLASLAVVAVALPGRASADVLLFDRGLPTLNLNNAAAPGRSNVRWADTESTNDPTTFWRPGDDFTLAGTGAYNINTIRVWSTDNTGLSLLGGLAGGPITLQSNGANVNATPVTYFGGQSYQDQPTGDLSQIYQIDFSVNIALNGGETYQFFLDGPPILRTGSHPAAPYRSTFLHASNATQSGSTQQGADDTFLFLNPNGSVETFNSLTGIGTFCSTPCPGAWDKVSDGNVQVFGVVPEPGSLAILGIGLAGLGFSRRKRAS